MLARVALMVAAIASPALLFAQSGDVRGVHDPCVIKQDGTYYVFSTGRGRGDTLQMRRSSDLRRWERLGSVFEELPAWTRERVPRVRNLWAPDVAFFGAKYHLYYSVSSFGSNQSCIGLATNVTLDPDSADYEWIDQGPSSAPVPRHGTTTTPSIRKSCWTSAANRGCRWVRSGAASS